MHFTGVLFAILSFATVGLTDITAETVPTATCGVNPVDVFIMIDGSGSVQQGNFTIMLDFVKTLIDGFEVGPDDAQFGIATFSTAVYPQFSLNTYSDKALMLDAIDNIAYDGGWTFTHYALNYVRETGFTAANGDRPDARNVLILITDGVSTDKPLTASAALLVHETNIVVLTVGITAGTNKTELGLIATDPSKEFNVDNFADLLSIKEELQTKSCEVCPFWSGTDALMIDGKCIRLFSTKTKWELAQEACQAEDSKVTLLEITSDTILQYVQQQVQASGVRTWLGATDAAEEGTWVWTPSGNTLEINSTWWGKGQPDDYQDNEDCLIMRPDQKINDYPCYVHLPYLCESLESRRV